MYMYLKNKINQLKIELKIMMENSPNARYLKILSDMKLIEKELSEKISIAASSELK